SAVSDCPESRWATDGRRAGDRGARRTARGRPRVAREGTGIRRGAPAAAGRGRVARPGGPRGAGRRGGDLRGDGGGAGGTRPGGRPHRVLRDGRAGRRDTDRAPTHRRTGRVAAPDGERDA